MTLEFIDATNNQTFLLNVDYVVTVYPQGTGTTKILTDLGNTLVVIGPYLEVKEKIQGACS